jgi:hypothetical protein
MKIRIYLLIGIVSIACFLSGCSINSSSSDKIVPVKQEESSKFGETQLATQIESLPIIDVENVRYASKYTCRTRAYNTLEELDGVSEFIFSGECISAKPIYQNETLYTLSKIKILQVYKGKIASDTVDVVEMGGRTTFGDYEKGCALEIKAFEEVKERLPSDYGLVVGTDGYYPLKSGEKVLLFAGDVSGFLKSIDEPLYGIYGDYDGKLYLQSSGEFARPIPSKTDNYIFSDDSLVIQVQQLDKIMEKSMP